MTELERKTVLEALYIARRIIVQDHDTVDGEHQTDVRPNWAMRATTNIDETMELVEHQS